MWHLFSLKQSKNQQKNYIRTVTKSPNDRYLPRENKQKPGTDPPANQNQVITKTLEIYSTINQKMYDRNIANTSDVIFINNSYNTPITIELNTTELETIVHLSPKHRKISITIKLLDISTTIIIDSDTIINYPDQFSMGSYFRKSLHVIKDKKARYPCFPIYHSINSIKTVSVMNWGDINIITILNDKIHGLTLLSFLLIVRQELIS